MSNRARLISSSSFPQKEIVRDWKRLRFIWGQENIYIAIEIMILLVHSGSDLSVVNRNRLPDHCSEFQAELAAIQEVLDIFK